MLLGCFASCTRCMSPRQDGGGAGTEEDVPAVPVPVPVEVAPEAAPEPPQVPAADDFHDPEPPFQTKIRVFNVTGENRGIRVTVDYSLPVNVVTHQYLKGLGFEPLRHTIPSELSTLATRALPGNYGWRKLMIRVPTDDKGHSFDIDFVVVGDDYHCDLLLGREFRGVSFNPAAAMSPNYATSKGKEERKEDERQTQERQAQQVEQAETAAERKRLSAQKLEQSRKEDPQPGDGAGEGPSAW